MNGGESWFSIQGDMPSRFVNALAVEPNDPRTVWAGTEDGLFRNRDAAPTWEPVNEGRVHDSIWSMAYRAGTRTVYVGTLGGGVYQRSFALFVDGFESGDTSSWSATQTP